MEKELLEAYQKGFVEGLQWTQMYNNLEYEQLKELIQNKIEEIYADIYEERS